MFRVIMVINQDGRSFRIGHVLIEGGKGGDVIPQTPIIKDVWDGEIKCYLTRWEMYDYQSFIGLYEVYNAVGEVKLYLVDSMQVYGAYKEEKGSVNLVEIDNITEYEKLLESYK